MCTEILVPGVYFYTEKHVNLYFPCNERLAAIKFVVQHGAVIYK